MSEQFKEYIGDGIYASFDGYQIWLRTSDGIRYTNEIALEPSVFNALIDYQERLARAHAARGEPLEESQ